MLSPTSRICAFASRLVCVVTLTVVSMVSLTAGAAAHFATVGFSDITLGEGGMAYDLWLDPYHLATLLPLDANDNTIVSAAEVQEASDLLTALAQEAVVVEQDGTAVPVQAGTPRLVTGEDVPQDVATIDADFPLVAFHLTADGPLDPARTSITYGLLLMDAAEPHRNVGRLRGPAGTQPIEFDPDHDRLVPADLVVVVNAPSSSRLAAAAPMGVGAVLLLFLILLLLLIARRRGRAPRPATT
ncbi:hypothetical protein [Euzebya pacifica]|uniref:hypothetical protein n=1 Tax=Euzebya pacifica TaxID=1608957 RepID=UPI0030F86FCD